MRGSVRRGTVCAAGLAAALLLAGCGDSGGGPGPEGRASEPRGAVEQPAGNAVQAMTAAAEKTTHARSAKVSMKVVSPAGLAGELRLSGVVGWGPLAMDLKVRSGSPQQALLPSSGRLLWKDDTLYLGGDEAERALPGGKRWLRLDVSDGSALAGTGRLAGGLEAVDGQDPGRLMALLRSAPDVKHLGTQRVDGVTAQHYKGTVTPGQVAKADGGLDFLDEAERAELLSALEGTGVRSYAIEAWVKDDLPVRIHTTVESRVGKVSVVQKLSDYGTEVDVPAPAGDDTVDLTALLKRFSRLGS